MCFTSYRPWSTFLCFFCVCKRPTPHTESGPRRHTIDLSTLFFSLPNDKKYTHIWLYNAHPAPLRLGEVGEPGLDHRLGVRAVELNLFVTVSV